MYSTNEKNLAKKILNYSVELKAGENVMLQLVGLNGVGLLRAMVEEARRLQAHPFVDITDTEIQRMLVSSGDMAFWERQATVDQLPLMKQMDAYVGIRATQNIYESSQVSADANKAYAKGLLEPVHFEERVNNTRWCIMRYPSEAFAMNAKMPTHAFESFFYQACLLDYARLAEAMKPLEERLRQTREVHLQGNGTDIRFSVEGQNWIPCTGKRNIPDGELFSSPILESVNGHIRYAPSVYQGKPFEFVELHVEHGVVVNFDSSNNKALEEILSTDKGASRFGEFSFGTNPIIERPMYDILFDEKIYGSNHLTLGKDYEIAANGNDSSIHWDLVCIGPDVYLDGQLVRKGRLFVTEDLAVLNPENLLKS
ncbi:MAG: aminopeptidase [Bacteroidetes bacterium]|nr:aminopeptidase [Bacteroidota bacterium]MCH8525030.1 aminopeptidase [Balneolales bacterium]